MREERRRGEGRGDTGRIQLWPTARTFVRLDSTPMTGPTLSIIVPTLDADDGSRPTRNARRIQGGRQDLAARHLGKVSGIERRPDRRAAGPEARLILVAPGTFVLLKRCMYNKQRPTLTSSLTWCETPFSESPWFLACTAAFPGRAAVVRGAKRLTDALRGAADSRLIMTAVPYGEGNFNTRMRGNLSSSHHLIKRELQAMPCVKVLDADERYSSTVCAITPRSSAGLCAPANGCTGRML